jgi:hypothetical protein
MQRAILVALLLAAVAAGQGVEDWIEQAVDPRTAPEQRLDALKRVAQTKEGLDRLAERGLDKTRDPEVVHAVVDTLLRSADYRPYIERMCRLLLVGGHREKILHRFKALGEHPEKGQPLLEECARIARESGEPALREAAILALAKIPRRRAVEVVVEVGLASTDEQVRVAARAYVGRLLGVATLREAADRLQARKLDTFWDLVEARLDDFQRKEAEHAERMRTILERASAGEALQELEKGGTYRLFAAVRLRTLAAENGIAEPTEFARRLFDCLTAELARESQDVKVLDQILQALQFFARDASGPLLRVKKPEEVRDTIQRLATVAGAGPEHRSLGVVAVRILGAIDDGGIALTAFAEGFPSAEVRKEAIGQLSQLALRVEKRRPYVGIKLAGLLARAAKEPDIRALILSLLTQSHVQLASTPDDVVAIVRGYLEQGATPELSDAELRDCAAVLGRRRTDEAKEALKKAAAGHPKLQARRYAVEEGLIPWARSDESIHEDLKALVLAPEQWPEARKAVIEALGKKGGRRAARTLQELAQSPDLPPDLLPVVQEAKLQLLKRLAEAGGEGNPEQKAADVEEAALLLEQEVSGGREIGSDVERLEKLADLVVREADAAKLPAGTARFRLAWLYARLPEDKRTEGELLRRYGQACDNAVDDRLPPGPREEMLKEYRDLLLRRPDERARLELAVDCAQELGRLSLEEKKDKVAAARYYLDAGEGAVKLGNPRLAEELRNKAMTTGGVGGELVAREQQLRDAIEKLPRSG